MIDFYQFFVDMLKIAVSAIVTGYFLTIGQDKARNKPKKKEKK